MLKKNLNLLYSAFIILWQSIQMNLLSGIDGAGRIISLFTLIVLLINVNIIFKKNDENNNPIVIRFLLLIWIFINSYFLYDPTLFKLSFPIFFSNKVLVPFVIILTISRISQNNIINYLKLIEKILFLSLIFNILGSNFIEGRLLNEEININEIVLVNLALMSTIMLNSLYFKRKILYTVTLLTIPVLFSIFSGSRMSVGATVILLIGFIISTFKNINWKTLIKVSIISVILFFITKDLLSKTVVFERLKSTTSQSEELSVDESKGTIFEYFGDRGSFYVEGIKIFSENPFLGIGLLNYAQTHEKVCHVEYIIYLAELGILGFLLYLLFLKSIYNRIMIKIRDNKNIKTSKFLLFVYFSIIFCGFVLFLYNSFAIAYLFGLLLLLTKKEKTKKILL